MLADVGQRLLDHAVGGEVDRGRDRDGLALGAALHPQADPFEGLQQLRELAEPRRGLARARRLLALAGLPQHGHRRAELAQRGPARLTDLDQGGARGVGLGFEHGRGDAGLDVDQRDVVADDVVQFAGYPQALLGDAAAGLLLAGVLGPAGPLLYRGDEGAATAHRLADGDGHRRPGEGDAVDALVPLLRRERHAGDADGEYGDPADREREPALHDRGDGVDRQTGPGQDGPAHRPDEHVADGCGDGAGQHQDRVPAAQREGGVDAQPRDEQDLVGVEVGPLGARPASRRPQDGDQVQQGREQRVGPVRVRAREQPESAQQVHALKGRGSVCEDHILVVAFSSSSGVPTIR